MFRVGDRVQIKFYGTIKRVNKDHTYDVECGPMDGGRTLKSVNPLNLSTKRKASLGVKRSKTRVDKKLHDFPLGSMVEVYNQDLGLWFPGSVALHHIDGSYDVLMFEDSKTEMGIHPNNIRGFHLKEMTSKSYWGPKVEVEIAGNEWADGRVTGERDGTFEITFESGGVEAGVSSERIRACKTSRSVIGDANIESRNQKSNRTLLSVPPSAKSKISGLMAISKLRNQLEANFGPLCEISEKITEMFKGSDATERLTKKQFVQSLSKANVSLDADEIDVVMDIFSQDGLFVKSAMILKALGLNIEGIDRRAASSGGIEGSSLLNAKVEANYRGRGTWYVATITQTRDDGTFDVLYDDGEPEMHVPSDCIKVIKGAELPAMVGAGPEAEFQTHIFRLGARVEGLLGGYSKYHPGRIARLHPNGTYDVDYDSGEMEVAVPPTRIRLANDLVAVGHLTAGMKVQAFNQGRNQWCPAIIHKDIGGDCFDIAYDNGDFEHDVHTSCIQLVQMASLLVEGCAVEANYRGMGVWRGAHIVKVRGKGLYDVKYEDDTMEMGMKEADLRFSPGDVDTNPSAIDTANVDINTSGLHPSPGPGSGSGPVAVVFDGTAKLEAAGGLEGVCYDEGARVEVNYRGKGKFYPGKIYRSRGNGLYDIAYDDGEIEMRVMAEMIVAQGGGGGAAAAAAALAASAPVAEFVVGASVQARYKGFAKYHAGKIDKINADGTCDIQYDATGEIEIGVSQTFIKLGTEVQSETMNLTLDMPVDMPESNIGLPSLMERSRVLGNYRGRGQWLPGTVQRVRPDQTYDVNYDQGQCERRVGRGMLKLQPDQNEDEGPRGRRPRSSPMVPLPLRSRSRSPATAMTPRSSSRSPSQSPARPRSAFSSRWDQDSPSGRSTRAGGIGFGSAAKPRTGSTTPPSSVPRTSHMSAGRSSMRNSAGTSKGATGGAPSPSPSTSEQQRSGMSDVKANETTDSIDYSEPMRALGITRTHRESEATGGFAGMNLLGLNVEVQVGTTRSPNWVRGAIVRDRGDGFFDILFDDGNTAERVAEERLRMASDVESPFSPMSPYSRGASPTWPLSVAGGGRGSAGRKSGDVLRTSSTMPQLQTQGESEQRLVRSASDGDWPTGNGSDGVSMPTHNLPEKTRVEANYRSRGKWYMGTISRDRADGTYDVTYDDGEFERRVERDMIRPLNMEGTNATAAASTSASASESVNNGAGLAPQATPSRLSRPSSAVSFAEGVMPHGKVSTHPGVFEDGARVECNLRNKGHWVPGAIARGRGDGSYDVSLDNGCFERRVPQDQIRKASSSSSSVASPAAKANPLDPHLAAGTPVEGNFKGMGQWLPGEIMRNRGDGTYDISYSNGDAERRVPLECIRPTGIRSQSGSTSGMALSGDFGASGNMSGISFPDGRSNVPETIAASAVSSIHHPNAQGKSTTQNPFRSSSGSVQPLFDSIQMSVDSELEWLLGAFRVVSIDLANIAIPEQKILTSTKIFLAFKLEDWKAETERMDYATACRPTSLSWLKVEIGTAISITTLREKPYFEAFLLSEDDNGDVSQLASALLPLDEILSSFDEVVIIQTNFNVANLKMKVETTCTSGIKSIYSFVRAVGLGKVVATRCAWGCGLLHITNVERLRAMRQLKDFTLEVLGLSVQEAHAVDAALKEIDERLQMQ